MEARRALRVFKQSRPTERHRLNYVIVGVPRGREAPRERGFVSLDPRPAAREKNPGPIFVGGLEMNPEALTLWARLGARSFAVQISSE